jgi:hypothetical protein
MSTVAHAAPLSATLPPSITTAAATTLFDGLLRFLREPSMSRVEQEFWKMALEAARVVGAPILEATDLHDLQDRIEVASVSPALERFSVEAAQMLTIAALTKAVNRTNQIDIELIRTLGEGPSRVIAQAWPLQIAEVHAFLKFIADQGSHNAESYGTETPIASAPGFTADGLSTLAYASDIPSEVRLAFLARMEATAAFLSISHAMFHRTLLQPWIALALAERYRDGLHASLAIWASIFPDAVPESIIPASERMIPEAIARRTEEANITLLALVAQADAAPDGVLCLGDLRDDP